MAPKNRYKKMERYMSIALIVDFLFFMLCLFVGSIVFLKVILSILIFLLSSACIVYLYLSKEILKPRSLWMTSSAVSILVCQLFSVILNFP